MARKVGPEALDCSLRDIKDCKHPMEGFDAPSIWRFSTDSCVSNIVSTMASDALID